MSVAGGWVSACRWSTLMGDIGHGERRRTKGIGARSEEGEQLMQKLRMNDNKLSKRPSDYLPCNMGVFLTYSYSCSYPKPMPSYPTQNTPPLNSPVECFAPPSSSCRPGHKKPVARKKLPPCFELEEKKKERKKDPRF